MSARTFVLGGAFAVILAGCGAGDNAEVLADAAHDAASARAAQALLAGHAADLHAAVVSLCAAAPLPPATGWSDATDPAAVAAMRAAWKDAHRAYQGLDGAADLLFPDLDKVLDGAYEDALAAGPDEDPFDAEGFVGLHAVERILWADAIPPHVVAAESALPGYVPAFFPVSELQAAEFHYDLCARLVSDAEALVERVASLDLGSPDGYEAGVRLVEQQVGKVTAAGQGLDESRYSDTTLADMRADVAAARATHEAYRPWLAAKPGGSAMDADVEAGFTRLDAAYAAVAGDGLPAVPPGWSAVDPTAAARAAPFGKLFAAASAASDDTQPGSLAHLMDGAAVRMGIGE
jgi:iron uptake system component EfeO